MKGVSFETAETAIEAELEKMRTQEVEETELTKVKNRMESMVEFGEMRVLDKAMNLAYYELLGDADLINKIVDHYAKVTAAEIREQAATILTPANCSTLYYKAI